MSDCIPHVYVTGRLTVLFNVIEPGARWYRLWDTDRLLVMCINKNVAILVPKYELYRRQYITELASNTHI